MTKKLTLFLLSIMSIISLSGCSADDDKIYLTFGTYLDEAVKLTYDELSPKMLDGENMIIAVYPGDNSSCGCWTVFERLLDDVVQDEHYQIYKISYDQFTTYGNSWSFPIYNDRPSLCFVEDGKIKTTYEYDTRDVNPLFKSYSSLLEVIQENCYKPNYYYIDETYLESLVGSTEDFIVAYSWASCPDCSYVFPNVLYPYSENKQFNTKMYVIDLEVEGLLLVDGVRDYTNENYVNFVDKYNLSNTYNEAFGYETGFVPTFQYYENGTLTDMCVYFNDKVELVNGEYTITRSYYSEERVKNLSFFSNIENYENYILLNKTLSSYEVYVYDDSISFIQESAAVYHDVILTAFLDTYIN